MLLAGGARGGDEDSGVETQHTQGVCKPSCLAEQGARVRHSQHRLLTQVNSSRTTRSAEAERPCNSRLFLPSTNQARGSSHATLDRVSSSRHGKTAQADVSLAKEIHENSRQTFPPSQTPPAATRRKPHAWPYSPALEGCEAHSPEQVGSCPFWVHPHHSNNLSL